MAAQREDKNFGTHPQLMMVPLWVSRLVRYPGEDGGIEIWGHVGDYEVKICRQHSDPEAKSLLRMHTSYLKMLADKEQQAVKQDSMATALKDDTNSGR